MTAPCARFSLRSVGDGGFRRAGERRCFRMSVAVALTGITVFSASSLPAQQNAKKTVEEKTLITGDRWPIHITYFQSALGKDAPVVVLLHSKGRNRLVWRADSGSPSDKKDFAQRLQDEGYAVITVDLRKHGQSKGLGEETAGGEQGGGPLDLKPGDYRRMILQDLEAVKGFIYEEHQKQHLNMRRMGIVAAEMSVPLAVNYALVDWLKRPYDDAPTLAAKTPRGQDVRALVLLSPEENLPGLRAGPALMRLRNPAWGIAILIGYGDKDPEVSATARSMYERLTGISANKKRVYLQSYGVKIQGTDLLGKRLHVEEHILGFLKKHLMELPDPWKDRKSPLQ